MAREIKKNKIKTMLVFQRKANIIFFQITTIMIVFAIVFFYSFYSLYSQILLISTSAMSSLEAVCGCTNHFSFSSHPYFFSAIFLIGLAMIVYCFYVLSKFIKLHKSTNFFVRQNLNKKKNLSRKLKSVVEYSKLNGRVTEINSEKPIIFCYSLLHPRICISKELVRSLDRRELIVVLMHEKMHMKNFEPLRLFFVKNLEKILFFLPGIKSLSKQYSVYSEMAADEFATNGFKNKASLAGALCKVLELERKVILSDKSLAISFFNITNERINKLINNEYSPRYKFVFAKFSLNIFILVFAAFSFYQIQNFDIALVNSHKSDSCVQEKISKEGDCKIFEKDLVCEIEGIFSFNSFNRCYRNRFIIN